MFSVVLVLTSLVFGSCAGQAAILEHPKTQYALVGDVVAFHCRAMGQIVYWLINDDAVSDSKSDIRTSYEERGFQFNFSVHELHHNLTMTTAASAATNNSVIECRALRLGYDYSHYVESRRAYLHVYVDFRPLPPSLDIANGQCSPDVLLDFSLSIEAQPLWLGYNISEFKVNITDRNNGELLLITSVVPYHENATANSFHYLLNETLSAGDIQRCSSSVLISATAVSANYGESMISTIEVEPSRGNISDQDLIDYEILFYRNSTPLLIIDFELPSDICLCQQIVYSIKVEDESFGITQNLGPYNQMGPGNMTKHTVQAVLQRDRNYTMSVSLESAGKPLKSTSYFFDTLWKPIPVACTSSAGENLMIIFKTALWTSVVIIVVLALIMTCLVLTHTLHRKGIHCSNLSTVERKRGNVMVKNPVYECPVYESIQPRFDTLVTDAQLAVSSSTTAAGCPHSYLDPVSKQYRSDTPLPNEITGEGYTSDKGPCFRRIARNSHEGLGSELLHTVNVSESGSKRKSMNSALKSVNRDILSKKYAQ